MQNWFVAVKPSVLQQTHINCDKHAHPITRPVVNRKIMRGNDKGIILFIMSSLGFPRNNNFISPFDAIAGFFDFTSKLILGISRNRNRNRQFYIGKNEMMKLYFRQRTWWILQMAYLVDPTANNFRFEGPIAYTHININLVNPAGTKLYSLWRLCRFFLYILWNLWGDWYITCPVSLDKFGKKKT